MGKKLDTVEEITDEAKKVIEQLGSNTLPSHGILVEQGYSYLSRAILKNSSFRVIRELLGEACIRKRGYWKNIDNIRSHLEQIVSEIGHFPTAMELKKSKQNGLLSAIMEYHGGITKVKEKMGYRSNKLPYGYWRSFENVRACLDRIIKEIGRFPTQIDIVERGYSSLTSSIAEYHGSLDDVARKMGYNSTRKKRSWWKDKQRFEEEMRVVIKQLGHFPTQQELKELERMDLAKALTKQGTQKAREELGYHSARKPKGYWKKWENVELELKRVIRKVGRFPSKQILNEVGLSSLSCAILLYHGGPRVVQERLGFSSLRKENGWQKDIYDVLEEARLALQNIGSEELPSQMVLTNKGYGYIANAIMKYHGGFPAFRQKLEAYMAGEPIPENHVEQPSLLEQYIGGEDE